MNFNTLQYFLFLPCSVVLYFLTPRKLRNPLLLVLSYFFYMNWEARYALLMLASTAITYICAVLMEKRLWGYKRLWLVINLVVNLAILFFFKYFNFVSALTAQLFSSPGMDTAAFSLDILLPVGISFYTFQALGYTMDVYRGQIKAERNFIDYALFVSFFPQLVAGPIERSRNLLPQIKETHRFSLQNIFDGALLFLWGLFKKMVVADTLAVIVTHVFDAVPDGVSGVQYLIAAFAFAVEIYCDFSAYSDIARGSALMLGFRLMKNFDAPYFAASIKDFWRRWHISLSTWFKDYLYFPLGGSRLGRTKTCVNLTVVFLVSGLWHGAALTFVVWGFLHGLYQVTSLLTKRPRERLLARLGISQESRLLNLFRTIFTFALVSLTFVFFRAQSIRQALHILKEIFLIPVRGIPGGTLSSLPLGYPNLLVCLAAVFICFAVDRLIHARRLSAVGTPLTHNPALRYAVYFILIAAIVIFGYYGSGYDPQEFIYFQF